MNVSSSQSWQQNGGDAWRKLVVVLGWADLCRIVAEGRVEGYQLTQPPEADDIQVVGADGAQMLVTTMYKVLQAQADLLLIAQMFVEAAWGPPEGPEAKKLAMIELEAVRSRCPILK